MKTENEFMQKYVLRSDYDQIVSDKDTQLAKQENNWKERFMSQRHLEVERTNGCPMPNLFNTSYSTDWDTLSKACSSVSQMSEAAKLLFEEKNKQLAEKQIQLTKQESDWKERFVSQRQQLEAERTNDVKRVQEKYELLLQEVRQRAERAEKELDTLKADLKVKESNWLNMFKGLYELSKTGTLHQMKDFIERSANGSVVDANEDAKYSISALEENNSDTIDVASKMLAKAEVHPKKTLGKRSTIARTPHGSNLELKVKRQQQTANIAKVLDGMKHLLPTMQDILDGLWEKYQQQEKSLLKALGLTAPFCDGIGVPKTTLTSTERQVRDLFQQHELKLCTAVAKKEQWFVKLDEDAMPSFKVLKARLKELSNSTHEKLAGASEFFLRQIDQTEEVGGFLYAKYPKKLIAELTSLGLKHYHGYHSTSLSINLFAEQNRRLKIYNKTMHPLFASNSVDKRIGMGGKQFFQSSNFFQSRVKTSENTGRLRVELSNYFKSKEEEAEWFDKQTHDRLPQKVIQHLRKYGNGYIKDIPFLAVWNAFWGAPKVHIFVEESHKAAVVYAYNQDTKQFIGGLLDVTQKKNIDLFHKEHSVKGREAIVIKQGQIVQRFIKEENIHCFPIFPRYNPKTWRHPFNIDGWDYYIDCKDVALRQLEVLEEPSIHSQSSQECTMQDLQQITVQQVMDGSVDPLCAEVLSTRPRVNQTSIILANHRVDFVARQEEEKTAACKREQKEETKRIAKAAKEQGRANRDEDMDFFAVYYQDKFAGVQFKEFKKIENHQERILKMLRRNDTSQKMRIYIKNQRNKLGRK